MRKRFFLLFAFLAGSVQAEGIPGRRVEVYVVPYLAPPPTRDERLYPEPPWCSRPQRNTG
jgi:hypothetical protein